jgi:uncharacterized membrane protein YeaQ/YmgE (transglycosylase-associated protein family)
MGHYVWTVIIGLIVGVIAKFLTPGGGPGGFFVTAAIGIAGSIVATFAGQAMGLYAAGHSAGWIASTIGAVALLLLYRMISKPKTTTTKEG